MTKRNSKHQVSKRDLCIALLGIQFFIYIVVILILTIQFDHFSPNLFEWWSYPPCRETLRRCLLLFPLGFGVWGGAILLDSR